MQAVLGRFMTQSEAETQQVGYRLGKTLPGGSVVLLYGEPGAGKTVFVRGLCAALGYDGYVTSPTFSLINEYEGDCSIRHMDLYRLTREQAMEIGLEEYVDFLGVVCIEWPEEMETLFADAYTVRIERGPGDSRTVCVERGEVL